MYGTTEYNPELIVSNSLVGSCRYPPRNPPGKLLWGSDHTCEVELKGTSQPQPDISLITTAQTGQDT